MSINEPPRRSAAQRSRDIREWLGLTREQYNKQYDILRNRVRNYERAIGAQRGTVSPARIFHDIAYRQSRGMRLTFQERAIMSASAGSTGTRIGASGATVPRTIQSAERQSNILTTELRAFRGLIERSPTLYADLMAQYERGEITGREVIQSLSDYGRLVRWRKKMVEEGDLYETGIADFYEA